MARRTNKQTDPAPAKGGVSPLVALNAIVFGKQQTAAPNSLFVPVSEKERDELLKLEAAREPNEQELALAEKLGLLSPVSSPKTNTKTADDATTTDEASTDASDDEIA